MVLILGACGTGGYLVTKDQIAQIQIGKSTKQGEGAIVSRHFAKLTTKDLTPSYNTNDPRSSFKTNKKILDFLK